MRQIHILIVFLLLILVMTTTGQQTIQVPTQFLTIQQAIQAAVAGDTVLVADGVYPEHIDFLGKNIIVKSNNGATLAILDGMGQPGSVVSIVSGEGPGAVLDGFTVQGGRGDMQNVLLGAVGGGINIVNSSPTIQNCIITLNAATQFFSISTLSTRGGGIRCFSVVTGGTSPVIRDCVISYNQSGNGAGIASDGANVTIERCLIDNNVLCNGAFGGGGVALFGGTHVFRECTITNNRNPCGAAGGGVLLRGGHLTMMNNIVANNISSDFPGVYVVGVVGFPASLVADHCSIYGNISTFLPPFPGTGVFVSPTTSSATPAYLQLTNSIVRANSGVSQVYSFDPPVIENCNITGGYPGTGNVDIDPVFLDPLAGNFHIDVTSPCVDTAVPWLSPPVDRDGNIRPFDGSADIGAYEYVAAMPPAGVGTTGSTSGGPIDVLSIDGTFGGTNRRIDAVFGDVIVLGVMGLPSSTIPSRFILWGHFGGPSIFERYATVLGDLSFTPAIVAAEDAGLFTVANSFWIDPIALLMATPAPWSQAVTIPSVSLRVALQGVIEETPGVYSITNGLTLNVTP